MIAESLPCSVRCSNGFCVQMCPITRRLQRSRSQEPFEFRDLQSYREKKPIRGRRFKSSLPDQLFNHLSCLCLPCETRAQPSNPLSSDELRAEGLQLPRSDARFRIIVDSHC